MELALAPETQATLDEIARLEIERDIANEKIRVLRASLPKSIVARSIRKVEPEQPPTPAVKPVPQPPSISDHAVLRYLERHYNFDFETIRKSLLSEAVRAATQMGATTVKTSGGRLIIQGTRVVTFIADRRKDKLKPKHRIHRDIDE